MNSHADEGLFVSILIYLMAVFAGLVLFIGPVLWANGSTIKENIGLGKVHELSASRYSDNKFPVAKLKHKELVNPTHFVELNARVKKTHNSSQSRHVSGRVRLGQKVQHAQIAHSYSTALQRQYHGSSSALSAQY